VFVSVASSQKETAALGPAGAIDPIVVAQGLAARGFALSPQGSLYVTLATPQNGVFAFPPAADAVARKSPTPALTPVAGTGVAGSLGDGGQAVSAQLSLQSDLLYERSGIVISHDGTIYIADTNNATIRSIAGPQSTEPGIIRSIAGQWAPRQDVTLSRPMGLALDRSGNLYIADHTAGTLDMLHQDSGILEVIAQVAAAGSVAVSPDGSQAFVASPDSGAVVAVDMRTRSIRPIAALAAGAEASSDTAPCAQGSSRICPAGLAADGAGNLFVADATLGRVLKVAPTGAATVFIANLQQPGAMAFDEQGRNLYVVEQGRSRVIEAQGAGDPPGNLSISPTSYTFPNDQPIGGISPQTQLVLTNNTSGALSGISTSFQPTAPAASTDFAVQGTNCLTTVQAGASCTINVSFTPGIVNDSNLGTLNSALVVSDSSGDSTSASLAGTTDDYQIQLAGGQLQEVSAYQGRSATFHLQVVALGTFGQHGEKVSLFCPGDVPANTICTVSPTSVTPTSTTPAPFTVTIATSSSTVQATYVPGFFSQWPRLPGGPAFPALGAGLAGALLILAARRFRHIRIVAVSLSAAVLLTGCHHRIQTALATPAGAADILIQGSAVTQNGVSLNATRGLTVTLDVLVP
jgi:sugar lactone lactonase YvrE